MTTTSPQSPEQSVPPTASSARVAAGPETARIAIIDDEPINVKIVRKHLQSAGYSDFITTSDSSAAMALLQAEKPDIVLLDVMMPGVDGIQILEQIRSHATLRHTPVLILTASIDAQTKLRALNAGATDFLAKPLDANDLLPRIRNTLIVKAHQDHLARYSSRLEQEVRARTVEVELSRLQVVHCLARAGECRDDATGRHVMRVGRYATALARDLGYSESGAATLGLAAQLHDVGKIGLPDAILLKPGKLTREEMEIVKRHCEIGRQIVHPLSDEDWRALRLRSGDDAQPSLAPARDPLLMLIANIVFCHHERWDGAGYPRGLVGEQIPLEARITSVADVFDALTSTRSYKPAMSIDESVTIMKDGRATQFDPSVLDAMMRVLNELVHIRVEDTEVALKVA